MGLMAVAATVSKDRIQPVGRPFIGLISFRSAGGIAGPGSISPSRTAKRIAARLPSPLKSVAPVLADWPNRSVFPDPVKGSLISGFNSLLGHNYFPVPFR